MTFRILFLLTGLAGAELATPRLSLKVENCIGSTLLTVSENDHAAPIALRIEWIAGEEALTEFKSGPSGKNSVISTHLEGRTGITRTVFLSPEEDVIFLHVRANQPGAIHFTARFISEDPVEIYDRRQLVMSGKDVNARAWIIPYESDVSDDGKDTITIAGEGEALVILDVSADPQKRNLAATLSRLGEKYDPEHSPPSPHAIWEGVIKARFP